MDGPTATALGALLAGLAAAGAWLFRVPARIIADQRRNLEHLRQDAQAHVLELATLREKLRTHEALIEEVEELRIVSGRLSLAALRGLKADALADAWDRCHDGIVLSRSGEWLWLNETLCNALGLSRDEVLALGWEALIDPAELRRTRVVEGSQWRTSVIEYVTHYRRAAAIGGGWVQLRWHCTAYDDDGNTFCVVWVEDVTDA